MSDLGICAVCNHSPCVRVCAVCEISICVECDDGEQCGHGLDRYEGDGFEEYDAARLEAKRDGQ